MIFFLKKGKKEPNLAGQLKISRSNSLFNLKLSIPFRFGRNAWNISYQFKKQNKTEQFSPRLKSRPNPDFPFAIMNTMKP